MSYFRTSTPEASTFRARRENNKWQRNQNTVAYATTVKMGPLTHTVLVALMVAVLGLIYLSQVTKASSFGYALQRQSDEMSSLTAQQQDLQIENARLQALNTVNDSSVAKAMTAPISAETVAN